MTDAEVTNTDGTGAAERLVGEARGVRGVIAAAVVSHAGEVVAAGSDDAEALDQLQVAATSALAAAEAFSGLLPGDDDQNLTVIYQDGHPLLFSPVLGGELVMVVAVDSAADIGRARFQLKRFSS